jgi:hypothetical protein
VGSGRQSATLELARVSRLPENALRFEVQLVRFRLDKIGVRPRLAGSPRRRPLSAIALRRFLSLDGQTLVGRSDGTDSAHRVPLAHIRLAWG